MIDRQRLLLIASLWALHAGSAHAASCSWIGGDGSFNDPARWAGCSGGNGDPANTPGPGDDVSIDAPAAVITLLQPARINSLDFSGGTIAGTPDLQIGTLLWSGGSFAGDPLQLHPAQLLVSDGTLSGTLQSADRQLRLVLGGTLVLLDGADLEISWNSPPGAPCGSLPFQPICIGTDNAIEVSSSVANPSVIDAGIANMGYLQIGGMPSQLQIGAGATYNQGTDARLNLLGGDLHQLGAGQGLRFAAGRVSGSGRLSADGDIEFIAAQLDIAGATQGTLDVFNSGQLVFHPTSRVIFDVEGPGELDQILSNSSVSMDGVLQVRSPLTGSAATFDLILAPSVSANPSGYDTALSGHDPIASGTALQLVPAAGLTCVWNGSTGSGFHTSSNWSGCGSGIPGASDFAVIDIAGASVDVLTPHTVSRLKLASPGGSLNMAPGAELMVNTYMKWVAGQVNSGAGGALHLDFGSLATVHDPNGLFSRQLNGTLITGAKLTLGDNFGITLGGSGVINNGGALVFAPGELSFNHVFGGGTLFNSGSITVLESMFLPGTPSLQQSSSGQTHVVGSIAYLDLQGAQSGLLQVSGGGQLTLEGSAASLDSLSSIQVDGQLVVQLPLQVQGAFAARRLSIDGIGASSGELSLDSSEVPPIERLEVREGVLRGSTSLQVGELLLEGGTVEGDPAGGDTLNVSAGMQVYSSATSSTVNHRFLTLGPAADLLLHNDSVLDISGNGGLALNGNLRVGMQEPGEVTTLSATSTPIFINRQVIVGPQQTLQFGGSFNPELGGPADMFVLVGDGVLLRSGQPLQLQSTVLRGTGSVQAQLQLDDSTVIPGEAGLPGILTFDGDVTLGPGVQVQLRVGGTSAGSEHDQLRILGAAELLNPQLEITQLGPFDPAPGDLFALLSYTSATAGNTFTGTLPPTFSDTHALDFDLPPPADTAIRLQPAGTTAIVVDRADDPAGPAGLACTAAANDCSLRGAILRANALPGADSVEFDLPGALVQRIELASPLPGITESLLIDGYSQAGALPNFEANGPIQATLRIELDGALAGAGALLDIAADQTTIRGLALLNCDVAIRTQAGTTDVAIAGNFIGVAADGLSAAGCGTGIELLGASATVGGPAPDRNLLAGNDIQILISGTALDAVIEGNLIGTDRSAMTLINQGEGAGIQISNSCNGLPTPGIRIGSASSGNLIAGMRDGVLISSPFGTEGSAPCIEPAGVDLFGNLIGMGFNGTPLPNMTGVHFDDQAGTALRAHIRLGEDGDDTMANVIAFNSGSGIRVGSTARGLQVHRNFIHSNAGLGVDLLASTLPEEIDRPTPNDPGDGDSGGNLLQNFPRIVAVTQTYAIQIEYLVDTPPTGGNDLTVDFYLNDDGQAGPWLGRDVYSAADHGGGATAQSKLVIFPGILAAEDVIIGIATDADFNSSEFSFAQTLTSLDPVTPEPVQTGTPRLVSGTVSSADGEPFQINGAMMVEDGTDSCGPLSLAATGTPGVSSFSCMLDTTGAAGNRTITASFQPQDRYFQPSSTTALSSVTGGNVPTSVAIDAIVPVPVDVGASYALSVVVSALAGADAPTGVAMVTAEAPFDGDSCTLSLSPLSATTAGGSCSIISTLSGLRQFRASYAGDTGFAPAPLSNPVSQVVRGSASIPAGGMQQSANPTFVGEPFQVSVLVRGGDGVPSGNVSVQPQPFGTPQSCVLVPVPQSPVDASCTTTVVAPVALGKILRASYAGSADGVFPPATAILIHDALRAITTTSITAHSPDPSPIGEPVTVSFTVSTTAGAVSAAAALHGQVSVSDGLNSCTGSLVSVSSGSSASGSCNLSLTVAGTRQLVASYQTSENFQGSVSTAVSHSVGGSASGTDLAVSIRNGQHVLNAGSTVEYVIEVLNLGSEGTGSARVVNPAPPQLADVSWSCIPTLPSQCPPGGNGSIDRLVDLVGGGRVTFRMSGTLSQTEGPISSSVSVTPPPGVIDTNPANNTATDHDVIGLSGDGFEAPGND